MVDEQKLRDLANKASGWKLDAVKQDQDQAEAGFAFVGAIDPEDISFSDVVRIDTGNYYQPEKAIEVANYIASANPAAILALLDELQTLRSERTAWRVTAENAEAAVKQAQEPCEYQFQDRNGKWRGFLDEQHKLNTIADGTWPIRPLFTRPQPAQLQRLSEEEVRDAINAKGMMFTAPDLRIAEYVTDALAAKNGVGLV